ncbi:protein DpdD [Actinosynnema sp. NPDC002837]
MNVADAVRDAVGDMKRFRHLRTRIATLVDGQLRTWRSGRSGWLVVPLQRQVQGFYLLSEDREGQRRGAEVLRAFLGPAAASIDPMRLEAGGEHADALLREVELLQASYVRRLQVSPEVLLDRIEDAVATVRGKEVQDRPVPPRHVDLIRDLRLALLNRDARQAERCLELLRFTGRLSAENDRFLTIEVLGRLERWVELRRLPFLSELLRTRRPRAIDEILLRMLWVTDVAPLCADGSTAAQVYRQTDLGARFGSLVNSVGVPGSEEGRAVAIIAATATNDVERVDELLLAATDERERDRLTALSHRAPQSTPTPLRDLATLLHEGQYSKAVTLFLDAPEPGAADVAAQATLDGHDVSRAGEVLAVVRSFVSQGLLLPGRRLLRDLDELELLADASCGGWLEWTTRLAGSEPWTAGTDVLRDRRDQWADFTELSPGVKQQVAHGLLAAWSGVNEIQVRASLDLLCQTAGHSAGDPHSAEFCEVVLQILSEQQNLSGPVRNAYLSLLERLVDEGPARSSYEAVLKHAGLVWERIASRKAVDWGFALVDILLDAPSPAPGQRTAVVTAVLGKVLESYQRLSRRQRADLSILAEQVGFSVPEPARQAEAEAEDVWRRLDNQVIGVYSLLPRVAESLRKRLELLCTPNAVEGNSDMVASQALRTLVKRADYMIVDTKHAAHAATGAIDALLPKDDQILPRGGGVTGFLQALERRLASVNPA